MENHEIIQVGTTLVLDRDCMKAKAGDVGVCYEVYHLGGRPGYSFIFETGSYDGFSPEDLELFFKTDRMGFVPEVSNYNFENVIKLGQDHDRGVFRPAFENPRIQKFK